jgi:ATP-dependent DNA helicase DinG
MTNDASDRMAQFFGGNGRLAQTTTGYVVREGQIQMAQHVEQVIGKGGTLVVEAGTGIGKTFAYLVPALLSGNKVLVSTATKALQDQLYGRDIPLLIDKLAISSRVSMLKGRASYLCVQRLSRARHDGMLQTPGSLRLLGSVEQWAASTRSGDVAEVPGLDESVQVLPLVTSTRENCAATKCPNYSECFLYKARREAMNADLVVVNHHLFFADANVRESGVAELLPTVQTVVFDEAHQLNDIGVQFLGRQWTTGQILSLGRDVALAGGGHARGLVDWPLFVEQLEYAVVSLHGVVDDHGAPAQRLGWDGAVPDGLQSALWSNRLGHVKAALRQLTQALERVSDIHPDFRQLNERATGLLDQIESAMVPAPRGLIRWLDVGSRLRCVESPMDISEAMQAKVGAGVTEASRKSWIFTSATLGKGRDLDWFLSTCGLKEAQCLQIASPFNYRNQAAIYVPKSFALPSSTQHSHQVATLVADSAQVIGGHTVVLTTTLRAMRQIAEHIRNLIPRHLDLQVIVQGEASKRELLARFQAHNGRNLILVGAASFWEGVDLLPGALQLLVIDKIPFAPPDDPLLQARCGQVEQDGGSAFAQVQVPIAAIALKQGAGRLIRRETDHGILVICDARLRRMHYGRDILAALPPMRPLSEPSQYRAALLELTTASTRGQT